MGDFIGPVIPEHLRSESEKDDESEAIGPSLPPGWKKQDDSEDQMIGPVLPPHLMKKRPAEDEREDSGSKSKSVKMDRPKVIGPTLPPNLSDLSAREKFKSSIGPSLPSEATESSDEDDEFTIGPLPPSGNFIEVEESRHSKSLQIPTGPKGLQREEWIASCPENSSVAVKLGFGKSMTSFSSKPVSNKEIEPVEHDSELDQAVDEYNKVKRSEALVDIHKKKIKEKKPEETPARQLFDFNPEEAMKVKQLDSQQTKSIIEKAKMLNSRFSNPRGQNKFL